MNEEALIRKIKKDKSYFTQIYADNNEKILNFVYSKVQNREVAEDIVSLVFEKALKGIDTFQWEGVAIQNWLFRIARNVIIDFYRKDGKRRDDLSMDKKINNSDGSYTIADTIKSFDLPIEERLVQNDEEEMLYKILMQFDENDQFLIYFKYFEDLTNKEIAKIMNISETNVGTKLQRLRLKIKNIYEDILKKN